MTYLHRWIWEQVYGLIPDGLEVRHKCDTPDCFRLDHLELGTHAENIRDMFERGRNRNGKGDHCPHGHAFDESNTYWRADRPGHRECRACRQAAQAKAYRKRKGGQ